MFNFRKSTKSEKRSRRQNILVISSEMLSSRIVTKLCLTLFVYVLLALCFFAIDPDKILPIAKVTLTTKRPPVSHGIDTAFIDSRGRATFSQFLSSSPRQIHAKLGYDINCRQDDLSKIVDVGNGTVVGKFAYVWYAASEKYFCSTLTALRFLKVC